MSERTTGDAAAPPPGQDQAGQDAPGRPAPSQSPPPSPSAPRPLPLPLPLPQPQPLPLPLPKSPVKGAAEGGAGTGPAGRLFSTPSGTALRFATLVALVLGSTALIHGNFAALVLRRKGTSLASARCQVRSGLYLVRDGGVDPDEAKWQRYWACTRQGQVPSAVWMAVAIVALLVIAALLYRFQPLRRSRRARLRPLGPEAAGLVAEIGALAAEAGLARPPALVVDPVAPHSGAVVFGPRRRRTVCLNAGLIARRAHDPEGFRAVVLHELAHLRNRDITVTYATLALWRAFVLVSLIPYVLTLIDPVLLSGHPLDRPAWTSASWHFALSSGWRVAALGALIYLTRTSVLRSRELYADARVAVWTGSGDPYRSLAPKAAGPAGRPADYGWALRWRRWAADRWGNHPGAAARARATSHPGALLRPGAGELLAAGIAVEIAWNDLWTAMSVDGVLHAGTVWFDVLRLLWSAAVTALLAVAVWRAAEYLLAGGSAGRGVFALPGAALAAGLAAGPFLDIAVGPVARTLPTTRAGLLDLLVLLAAGVGTACWAGGSSKLLGDRVVRLRGLALAAAVLLVVDAAMARWTDQRGSDGVWRGYLGPLSRELGHDAAVAGWAVLDPSVARAVVLPFVLNASRLPVLAALAALWLLPLLLRPPARRQIGAALLAGVAGAAGWCLLDLVLRGWARGSVGPGVRSGEAFAVVFTSWELAALAAVLGAMGLAAGYRRVRPSVAGFACSVAAALGGVLLWSAHWADGCSGVLRVAPNGCFHSLDNALAARPLQSAPLLAVAALLGLGIGRAVRAWAARGAGRPAPPALPDPGATAPPPPPAPAAAPARPRMRRPVLLAVPVTLAALCLAMLAFHPSADRDVLHVGAAADRATGVHSARVQAEELAVWVYGGGWEKFLAVQRRTETMFAALSPYDEKAFRTGCARLHTAVRTARRFPAPPEDRTATHWTRGLAAMERGSRQCVTTLGPSGDHDLNPSGLSYQAGQKDLLAFVQRVSGLALN